MQQLKKEEMSMHSYLATLKSYSDKLTAVGEPVKTKDYIWYMLDGLPAEYDAVVTAIFSRPDQPTIEEVQSLLVSFDLRLGKRQVSERLLPQLQHTSTQNISPRSNSPLSDNTNSPRQTAPTPLHICPSALLITPLTPVS